MNSIATKFPYLVKKKLKEGQEVRRVAQLDWKIIDEDYEKPFIASGLKFVPLPVMHGEDYICLGFLFGEKCKVAYITDVSRFPSNTDYFQKWRLTTGSTDIGLFIQVANESSCLVLIQKGSHNVHLCLPQSLEALKRICPKRALLIGMTHDFDHHKDNQFLKEWSIDFFNYFLKANGIFYLNFSEREGIHVQLARDGLRVPIDL
ncbi:hypothetical protein DITRI_Ditri02bG0059400 [Diplodiscus trichospermus]